MRIIAVFLIFLCTLPAAEKIEKWIYKSTNLLVDKNVDELEALMKRGHAAGYTHMLLADSKFSRLADMYDRYFNNVDRVKKLAAQYQSKSCRRFFRLGIRTTYSTAT